MYFVTVYSRVFLHVCGDLISSAFHVESNSQVRSCTTNTERRAGSMAGLRPLVQTAAACSRGTFRSYVVAATLGARCGAVKQHQCKTLMELPRAGSSSGKQHSWQWRGISSTATGERVAFVAELFRPVHSEWCVLRSSFVVLAV